MERDDGGSDELIAEVEQRRAQIDRRIDQLKIRRRQIQARGLRGSTPADAAAAARHAHEAETPRTSREARPRCPAPRCRAHNGSSCGGTRQPNVVQRCRTGSAASRRNISGSRPECFRSGPASAAGRALGPRAGGSAPRGAAGQSRERLEPAGGSLGGAARFQGLGRFVGLLVASKGALCGEPVRTSPGTAVITVTPCRPASTRSPSANPTAACLAAV
jgi:hypothetical protein